MGMYDTVTTFCPGCGKKLKFLSRAGDCKLINYSYTEVPVEIAKDIEGDPEECPGCERTIKLDIDNNVFTVAMKPILTQKN